MYLGFRKLSVEETKNKQITFPYILSNSDKVKWVKTNSGWVVKGSISEEVLSEQSPGWSKGVRHADTWRSHGTARMVPQVVPWKSPDMAPECWHSVTLVSVNLLSIRLCPAKSTETHQITVWELLPYTMFTPKKGTSCGQRKTSGEVSLGSYTFLAFR